MDKCNGCELLKAVSYCVIYSQRTINTERIHHQFYSFLKQFASKSTQRYHVETRVKFRHSDKNHRWIHTNTQAEYHIYINVCWCHLQSSTQFIPKQLKSLNDTGVTFSIDRTCLYADLIHRTA